MAATRIGTAIGKKIAKGVDKAMDKNKSSKTSPKDTQGSSTKERRMLDTKTGSKDTPPQRRDTSAYPAPPKRSTAQAKK